MRSDIKELSDLEFDAVDKIADMLGSDWSPTITLRIDNHKRQFSTPSFMLQDEKAGLIAVLFRQAIEVNKPLPMQFLINQGDIVNSPLCDISRLARTINTRTTLDQDQDGNYPLHLAAHLGHEEAVEVLVNNRAELNLLNSRGKTPAHIAFLEKKFPILEYLVNAGADVNFGMQHNGWTLLHLASEKGNTNLVRLLLSKEAKVDQLTKGGWTALLVACSNGAEGAVELLLASGASVKNITPERGETALHLAARLDNPRILTMLIAANADPNARNEFGQTPLMCACNQVQTGNVKVLLDKGADPRLTTNSGDTAAHELFQITSAGDKSQLEILKLLDGHGSVTLCELNTRGDTPLHNACFSEGYPESVQFLIDKNPKGVNQLNKEGDSPLCVTTMCVHSQRNLRVVEVLLANGAKPNRYGPKTVSALFNVCRHVNWDECTDYSAVLAIARLLISKGANINENILGIRRGITPLEEAIIAGADEMVELLLASGATVDPENLTKIYYAIGDSSRYIVRIFGMLLAKLDNLENCVSQINSVLKFSGRDRSYMEDLILNKQKLDNARREFKSSLDFAIAIQGKVQNGPYVGQPTRDLREILQIYSRMDKTNSDDYRMLVNRCVELKTKNHPLTVAAINLMRAWEALNQRPDYKNRQISLR